MYKISITYPESWLTVNVSVHVKWSGVIDNSWVAIETWTTKTYIYEFNGDSMLDYVYVSSVTWYDDISWSVFSNDDIAESVWSSQISDYSWIAWTFATKFEQYGWVSHIIHDSKWVELTLEEKELIRKNKETMDKVITKLDNWITKNEIIAILNQLKAEPTKHIIAQPTVNISPIINELSNIKTTLTLIANKKDEHSEVSLDIIAEWLPAIIDRFSSIESWMDTILNIFDEYKNMVDELKKDRDNYKKLITELTK